MWTFFAAGIAVWGSVVVLVLVFAHDQ